MASSANIAAAQAPQFILSYSRPLTLERQTAALAGLVASFLFSEIDGVTAFLAAAMFAVLQRHLDRKRYKDVTIAADANQHRSALRW